MTPRRRKTAAAEPKRKVVTIPMARLLDDLQGGVRRSAPPDFSPAWQALERLERAHPRRGRHLREAVHRMRQLEWIAARVWQLELKAGVIVHLESLAADDRGIEVITLCEGAYYFAARLKRVISEIGEDEKCVLCKNFDPRGVRTVRNHLIEHTKDPTWMFATGGSNGPRLKPTDEYRGAEFDRGLYVNIDEFLKEFVDRAHNEMGVEQR